MSGVLPKYTGKSLNNPIIVRPEISNFSKSQLTGFDTYKSSPAALPKWTEVKDSNISGAYPNRESFEVDPDYEKRDQPVNAMIGVSYTMGPPTDRERQNAMFQPYQTRRKNVSMLDLNRVREMAQAPDDHGVYDEQAGRIKYRVNQPERLGKLPNYVTKSKVDHVTRVTPQGTEIPETSISSLEDFKHVVEGQYHADTLSFRQNMMNSLMQKDMRRRGQLREFAASRNVR